jgi:hypothetical protein
VTSDGEGLAALARLGLRAVPVVSRGDDFVHAVDLAAVSRFLDLAAPAAPALAPDELVARLDVILVAALCSWCQIPPDKLNDNVRNRDRILLGLGHHIFRVVEAMLDAAGGRELRETDFTAPPPSGMTNVEAVADYGDAVRARVKAWWDGEADPLARRAVATYYGPQSLHELLERTCWHAAQHVRQLAMALQDLGIAPARPLTEAELSGLPLPDKVWDTE